MRFTSSSASISGISGMNVCPIPLSADKGIQHINTERQHQEI